ncbi:hypothetical protein KC344_g22 [Hortaea werneckii]|nr:hypothetical protein KC344_g22 [Hortaea werneckii]
MLASSERLRGKTSFSYRSLLRQAIDFPSFNNLPSSQTRLKLLELLDGGTGPGQHTEDVETDLWKFMLVKHTVLLSGRHWPTVTWSPSDTRKAGLTYSRRMIRVRCILVETTVPVRIRPRIETRPVKGHFLRPFNPLIRMLRGLDSRTDVRTLNGVLGRPEAQTDVLVPSLATLSLPLRLAAGLLVLEDVRLLLVGALALHGQLGRHDCSVGWLRSSREEPRRCESGGTAAEAPGSPD